MLKNRKEKTSELKELRDGIYEVIAPHIFHPNTRDIYNEYMNLNINNGTICYSLTLVSLIPESKPDILKISDYMDKINKYGADNINGAKEFMKFIKKYPEIYNIGLENEQKSELENIEQDQSEELI